MILIGSKAIKYWFSDFPREGKDIDLACIDGPNWMFRDSDDRIEYLINPVLWKRYNYPWDETVICSPDDLYTLKISHSIGWELENGSHNKHLWDINFLKNKGCILDKSLFDELYSYWETIHGKNKRSDLNMGAKEFFDNAVECKYDHDWLHTLINPYPTFNKVLKDGAEVEVDENKFNLLTEEEKELLVREEVYVMAYERFSYLEYPFAYSKMLKKFLLNHAPIWEALWMIQNWPKLVKTKFNFIKHINERINESNRVLNCYST